MPHDVTMSEDIEELLCAEMLAIANAENPKKVREQGFQRTITCATHKQEMIVDDFGRPAQVTINGVVFRPLPKKTVTMEGGKKKVTKTLEWTDNKVIGQEDSVE